ncbi:MAG: hypothetical protein KDJ37_02935 [Hyphomicrobiaceae bacterium]|nr:hypothetical protein [Hyphomicrobiaceae bacterium]
MIEGSDSPAIGNVSSGIVIVTVHGTNDADVATDGERWWQRGSRFVTRLGDELAVRGVAPLEIMPVHWSGANSDFDRLEGATELARTLKQLARDSRRYAVIGHSHGGNVALEGLGARGAAKALSGVVTFGTPFFIRRLKLVPMLIALFQVLLGLAMTPLMAVYFWMYWGYLYRNGLYEKLVEPVVLFGGLGALSLFALWRGLATLTRHRRAARELRRSIRPADWLVVHSPRDEAMRLLETAAILKPNYVTSAWGVRSLSRLATFAGLIAVAVFLWLLGGYLLAPLIDKVKAGQYDLGTAADLTFLLIVPVVYAAGWLVLWLFARLGGGWLYAYGVNHFISGGLIGAAYGGDGPDHLARVERTPPALDAVLEARIDALNLGGIDDKAIFESAQGIYERLLAGEPSDGSFGDPDKMWKLLSDALYHNAYMRDDGVIGAVAEHIAARLAARR